MIGIDVSLAARRPPKAAIALNTLFFRKLCNFAHRWAPLRNRPSAGPQASRGHGRRAIERHAREQQQC
jgi:hypothetical protein